VTYLRFPHLHGDLVAFVAEDDIWLAPIDTPARAWRLTSDGARAANPRFSRDGTQLAWTSWRDGDPEVYVTDTEGSAVIHTDTMRYDVARSLATTNSDVRIDFSGHILTARGLVANLKERTVRLESKVNGRFHR